MDDIHLVSQQYYSYSVAATTRQDFDCLAKQQTRKWYDLFCVISRLSRTWRYTCVSESQVQTIPTISADCRNGVPIHVYGNECLATLNIFSVQSKLCISNNLFQFSRWQLLPAFLLLLYCTPTFLLVHFSSVQGNRRNKYKTLNKKL